MISGEISTREKKYLCLYHDLKQSIENLTQFIDDAQSWIRVHESNLWDEVEVYVGRENQMSLAHCYWESLRKAEHFAWYGWEKESDSERDNRDN